MHHGKFGAVEFLHKGSADALRVMKAFDCGYLDAI